MRAASVLGFGLWAATAWGQPATVTGGGVSLSLSPDGEVRLARPAPGLAEPGGFSLADFAHQPEPVNLVTNPGFEDGATGWTLAKTQAIDPTVAHSGKASARITIAGPEPASSDLRAYVPVTPGHRYRLGLWLRRHQAGIVGCYASELDSEGKFSGPVGQVGLAVPTGDDTWHYVTRELEVGPRTTKLLFRADIYRSTGTLWLDDFLVAEVGGVASEPVRGRVEPAGGGLRFTGERAGCQVSASFTGDANALRIDGRIEDRTGADRAVGLTFALPVDATGGTWWDDPEERRPAAGTVPLRNAYACVSGVGQCSIYPWSALDARGAGLSLALPLSQGPRVFLLEYDPVARRYQASFYFGLAKDLARSPSAATFSLVLYAHDPAWGMRSAIERYYALFGESFRRRPPADRYLNYVDLERVDPKTRKFTVNWKPVDDAADFGEAYDYLTHVHGCYAFRMMFTDDPTRPTDEQVLAFLKDLAAKEQASGKTDGYLPTAELIKRLVYDDQGHLSYIADTRYWKAHEGYNHGDRAGWGLNFRQNEDPGISDHLARASTAKIDAYVATHPEPWSGTVTADAIEGYFANQATLDHNRAHFATTRLPLSFQRQSLKPGIPNTIWDFLDGVWKPLTEARKVAIYGNANGYEEAFTLPYVDVPMIENDWDTQHPGRMERYYRALNGPKITRWWRADGRDAQDLPAVEAQFQRGLAYALFPSVAAVHAHTGNLEPVRALYRRYLPAIAALAEAGWQPVPYARATGGVIVERYGDRPDFYGVAFTLRNLGEAAADTAVTLDPGLRFRAGTLYAYDLLAGPATAEPLPKPWLVSVPAKGARGFWVGTREELNEWCRRQALRDLRNVERGYGPFLGNDAKLALSQAERALESEAINGVALSRVRRAQTALLAATVPEPIDLAKRLQNVECALSPLDLAGILPAVAPRTVEASRGEPAVVKVKLTNAADQPLTITSFTVQAAGLPEASLTPPLRSLASGERAETELRLPVAADYPRSLVPYVVRVGTSATGFISLPVDVVVRAPLAVADPTRRVYRGQANSVTLRLTNALGRPAKGTLRWAAVPGFTFQPAEVPFEAPAGGGCELPVQVTLATSVMLGRNVLGYTIDSPDPALRGSGTIGVSVAEPAAQVRAPRAGGPITVDGKLDEAAWRRPATIAQFVPIPGAPAATEATSAWLAWSDEGLYVAFRCAESAMAKVKAELTERGAPLYQDDDVELFFQPEGQPGVTQLAVNPLGTMSDNVGNREAWRAAAQRGADGWTVEVFIPRAMLGLKGQPAAGFLLPMQLGRQEKPHGQTSSWTPTTAFRALDRMGDVVFE